MALNKVSNTGNWGDQANIINENNTKVAVELEKLKQATSSNYGYFNTSDDLVKIQYPVDNHIALVGIAPPYAIWKYDSRTGWSDTGEVDSNAIDVSNKYLAIEIDDEGYVYEVTAENSVMSAEVDDDGNLFINEQIF